ncbi:DUF2892 domain-containing protein [Gemmatimonadota bacterium]
MFLYGVRNSLNIFKSILKCPYCIEEKIIPFREFRLNNCFNNFFLGKLPLISVATGWCPVYVPFGISTCEVKKEKTGEK